MEVVIIIIKSLAAFLGILAALLSILLFMQLHWPSPVLWILKLYASALSPIFVLIGVLGITVGLATSSLFISSIGLYNILSFGIHIFGVTRPPAASGNFERAFGLYWKEKINSELKKYFLPRRSVLKLPAVPHPGMKQNISFATIPGTDRKLLCDIWQPPENITPSGLALIYLHGAGWYILDKDLGTRPFFSHLAAQGHVIMDVAYRLAPETDMMGMVNDVKRAINWMKENAGSFGVNPDRVVVSGGSSGGHLALMAAYTAKNLQFTPKEIEGKDISVRGVISFYGPADLEAMYYHTNQHITTRPAPGKPIKTGPANIPEWIKKIMGKEYYRLNLDKEIVNTGTFAPLLGGHPDECPGTYALFSPVTHVHLGCPPSLLIHGEHDVMAPVKCTRSLYTQLVEKNVPTVMHILPQTDHAFDLQLPKISPSAHNAIFDTERFLAMLV